MNLCPSACNPPKKNPRTPGVRKSAGSSSTNDGGTHLSPFTHAPTRKNILVGSQITMSLYTYHTQWEKTLLVESCRYMMTLFILFCAWQSAVPCSKLNKHLRSPHDFLAGPKSSSLFYSFSTRSIGISTRQDPPNSTEVGCSLIWYC